MGSSLSTIDQNDYPGIPIATQKNADWTLGPCFTGWAINLFLCGIVLSWVGTYRSRCATDKVAIKAAVAVAVIFECLAAGTGLISIIQHGIAQDRDNNTISLVFKADAMIPTLGAVSAVVAEAFFASRCFALLPRKLRLPFLFVIIPLIAAGFVGALGTTVVEYVNHGATDVTRGATPDAYDQLYCLAMLWLWANVAADVMISTLLLTRLWQNRSEVEVTNGQVNRTDILIESLMRLSFETAILTTICAAAGAACYVTMTETTNNSMAFTIILPGLYTLSLLWALNSRHRVAQEIDNSRLSDQIQLVWNLAERPVTISDREAAMADIVHGRSPHLAVTFSRGAAPRKAISQLGHNVRLITIDDKRRMSASSHPESTFHSEWESDPEDLLPSFAAEEDHIRLKAMAKH